MKTKTLVFNRNFGLELLRIISMLMIVTLHYLGHGNVLETVDIFSFNYYIAWFIQSLSYVSVNIFVLISGYFLVDKEFKSKNLICNLF
jgi:surface polysaccharide O-acyltransferase-like enzyme